jgi:hypothetical protein
MYHRWLAKRSALEKLKPSISRNSYEIFFERKKSYEISNAPLYVTDAAMTFSPLLNFVEPDNLAAWIQNKYLQATDSSI